MSATTMWLLGVAGAALVGGLALLAVAWCGQRRERTGRDERFERLVRHKPAAIEGQARDPSVGLRSWLVDLGSRSAVQRVVAIDAEIPALLRRAGVRGREGTAIYAAVQVLLPLAGVALAMLAAGVTGASGFGSLALLFAGFALAFLAPKFALRWHAARVHRCIREELPAFGQLLRVLYDAGLGTEQGLSVLASNDSRATPTVKREVEEVLRLVGAGSSLAEATHHVAADADVPELVDLFGLLRHIDRYGGAIEEPLSRFVDLLLDRRRTELQETVSRLSAKMTVVMVTCLLPALMVFLAGPAFTSIIRALGGMRG